MKKNSIIPTQIFSLVKQNKTSGKANSQDKAKQDKVQPQSKIVSPIRTIEVLLGKKNRDEIPIVVHQNLQFQPKKQPFIILKPQDPFNVLPSQRFEKFVKSIQPSTKIQRLKQIKPIDIKNIIPSEQLNPSLLKLEAKKIPIKPQIKQQKVQMIKKNEELKESLPKKQEEKLIILKEIENKNEPIIMDKKKDGQEKPKEGTAFLKLHIKNQYEINVKLNTLQNQLSETNQRINLQLETYFENNQVLLNFCTKFLKFGNQITFLSWNVKGYFQNDGSSDVIGELLSRFQNLYRFDFKIVYTSFSESGGIQLAQGLKKLINLHILSFNVVNLMSSQPVYLNKKAISPIITAISSLPNLELLYSRNLEIKYCTPSPKLSNFTFHFNDQWNLFNNKQKQMKDLKKQENTITNLTISDCDTISVHNKINYYAKLKQLFNLNYLTRVDIVKSASNKQVQILKQQAFCKKRNIYSILSFQKTSKEFLNINPVMVMTDLWID